MRVSGGYALMDALHRHGVKHIFGYPGGAILPIYDLHIQLLEVTLILVLQLMHRVQIATPVDHRQGQQPLLQRA